MGENVTGTQATRANLRTRLAAAVDRLRTRLSEKRFLSLLAIIVGAAAGIGAAILKDLITAIARLVKGYFPVDDLNLLLFILPVLGVLLCGIFCRYLIKDNMEFGTQRIVRHLENGQYRLPRHLAWAPAVACALTIGFGCSAGSEGPIAYTGAGIGSNIGKYFRLSDETLRTLVIIGAAAGIAGIFKAPIGGALFALEVLGMAMTTNTVIALVFSCLAASFIAYALSGFTIDIPYLPKAFFIPDETWAVVALGIFCGIYSVYYNKMAARTEKIFLGIKNPWTKNLISGTLVGAMVFMFPVMFGEGYGVLTGIINGEDFRTILNGSLFYHVDHAWIILVFLFAVMLIKSIAVAATNSGGGVGGDFAPTLFAGCMSGLFFALILNNYLGAHVVVANFALFGMAAVMAGAIQAPLMAIFLTAEIVGDFAMFFPLTIAALASFVTSRLLSRNLEWLKMSPSWHHTIYSFIHKL